MIKIDDVEKVEIRIGHVLSAERIEGSEKLLKLSVDFAEDAPRHVVSGIAGSFPDPLALVGKKCAFVTNLEPRTLMGIESQAMILAAHDHEALSLLEVDARLAPGSRIN